MNTNADPDKTGRIRRPRCKRARYPLETKVACMTALLTGNSVSYVARKYKIPKGTISTWKTAALWEVGDIGLNLRPGFKFSRRRARRSKTRPLKVKDLKQQILRDALGARYDMYVKIQKSKTKQEMTP